MAEIKLTKQQLAYVEKIRHWQRHPDEWAAMMFPEERFTAQQVEAWQALGKLCGAKLDAYAGKELTEEQAGLVKKIGLSIQSGRGTGKDAWLAITELWFMSVFDHPKIPTTAPSAHQLKDVLWSEISKWIRRARKNPATNKTLLEEIFEWQSDKVFLKEFKGKEWFAVARTVNAKASSEEQAETLSGFHEDFMMFAVDEATGVPDPVFRPIEATLTGRLNIAILIFNPTRSKGFAIRTHREDSARWVLRRWNAEESELVTESHIQSYADTFGKDSNPYRINILGLPPVVDNDTLIPWDWIMDAVAREIIPLPTDAVTKTADFGAGGDKSVICTRKGCKVYPLKRKTTPNSNELTDWVVEDIIAGGADAFGGDVIGIGWAVMGNVKARAPRKCTVRNIDSRSRAADERKYKNKRAEMYWLLREDFQNGVISIPNDQELIDQLGAIKYGHNDRGQIYIWKKEKLSVEIGHSPDEADAVAMQKVFNVESLRKSDDYDDDDEITLPQPKQYGWMAA